MSVNINEYIMHLALSLQMYVLDKTGPVDLMPGQ